MKRRLLVIFLIILIISFIGISIGRAQVRQSGSIRGIVVDDQGEPLPGVTVEVKGPALIGTMTFVTTEKGIFRIPALPPGENYVIICTLDGFQTVRREGLIVNVGKVTNVRITMKPSVMKEEVTVVAASPMVDVASNKVVQNITTEVIETLPIARDIVSAIQIAPGVVERRVHGSSRNDAGYMIDGVIANAPNQGYAEARISWETIEEIEFITAGATPEGYHSTGGFMNVVTKSGGNNFSGMLIGYYTNEDLSSPTLPEEKMDVLGISKPFFSIHDIETSGILGGPIVKDKLWFFANYRFHDIKNHNRFRPTTILGKYYGPYEFKEQEHYGYLKLTSQLAQSLRLSTMLTLWWRPKPYNSTSWNRPAEAWVSNNATQRTGTALLSWIIDQNTFVDFRAGFWRHQSKMPYSVEECRNNPQYYDAYTGYYWGAAWNYRIGRKFTWIANAKLTRFQDDFLGGDHEFKLGFEFQYGSQLNNNWRPNSISLWTFYNENPYYYRGLYGLDKPHPTYGDGRINLTTLGTEDGASAVRSHIYRVGGFFHDSMTIAQRFTLNFGLRVDYVSGGIPGVTDNPADSLAQAVGEFYMVPKYGFNPFGLLQYEEWDPAMTLLQITPTFGLTYDLFGDGKTVLKSSFGRYPEALVTAVFESVYPAGGRTFNFYWWDLNGNRQPDAPPIDAYKHYGASPAGMMSTLFKERIDPNITSPYVNEAVFAVEHELVSNLKVSLSYIWKDWKNVMGDQYYDFNTGSYWSKEDSGYWIPFTTTIPAYGNFPAQEVTMYFLSKDAPEQVTRLRNIDDAKRTYQAFELSFIKRMSHGWQLGGSLVISSLKGNYPVSTSGFVWNRNFRDPNWYINADGNLPSSRPLQIKLYGSAQLPAGFLGSFFFVHSSGSPWQRTITVVPPSSWAEANNVSTQSFSINVEPRGSRWTESTSILDLRLEKRFEIKDYGFLSVFVDIYNVLGNTYFYIATNPGGVWRPVDNNTNEGTYSPGWTGITGFRGVRTLKFSLKFTF